MIESRIVGIKKFDLGNVGLILLPFWILKVRTGIEIYCLPFCIGFICRVMRTFNYAFLETCDMFRIKCL